MDLGRGAAADGNGLGHAGGVAAHQRDACRVHRHIGAQAQPVAHGQADIGSGECGRVVDAVAHHRHRPPLLELVHDARLVGVVASLIERKGHRFLLDAMSQIDNAQLPDNSQLHAVFAGEGVLRAELEAQVRVLDLQQRVHFLGFRDDAKTIMAACDIVALPSLKEGLSIAAMEAMWLRRAVVATAIAGMPELVVDGETGLLVPPADAASLARALEKLLNDDTLRARLADNGHDWLQQHFDEKKCFAQTEKFLLNVIETWRDGKRVNCDFLG